MKLHILGSSSSGNGYVLESEPTHPGQSEALIIECGMRIKDAFSAINYKSNKIVGALISHEHGDHSAYTHEYLDRYIPVYASKGTANAIARANARINVVKELETFSVGSFRVIPFSVNHDAAEPMGFFIRHEECGNLLFVTDTKDLPHRFANISNVLIECNYDENILVENARQGKVNYNVMRRTMRSHMSLETCISTLRRRDFDNVNNIILLHLSSANADPAMFQRVVERETGKTVTIAKKGKIELNKTPF